MYVELLFNYGPIVTFVQRVICMRNFSVAQRRSRDGRALSHETLPPPNNSIRELVGVILVRSSYRTPVIDSLLNSIV